MRASDDRDPGLRARRSLRAGSPSARGPGTASRPRAAAALTSRLVLASSRPWWCRSPGRASPACARGRAPRRPDRPRPGRPAPPARRRPRGWRPPGAVAARPRPARARPGPVAEADASPWCRGGRPPGRARSGRPPGGRTTRGGRRPSWRGRTSVASTWPEATIVAGSDPRWQPTRTITAAIVGAAQNERASSPPWVGAGDARF